MAAIEAELLQKLKDKLGRSQAAIYARIDQVSRDQFLEKRLAALYLAAESGINISKYASRDDWALLQQSNQPRSLPARVPDSTTPRGTGRIRRPPPNKKTRRRGKKIWVVRGRDKKINRAMDSFLSSVGLDPMEFLKAAKKPAAHIGEILDSAFDEATAVVVLLTPDDQAKLNRRLLTGDDGDYERKLTPQARPNVIFEAGMAFGRNPKNVVIAEFGKLRPFTDISGRHVVKMNNTPQKRKELIQKLKLAGCDVDDSGERWLDEGDFSL